MGPFPAHERASRHRGRVTATPGPLTWIRELPAVSSPLREDCAVAAEAALAGGRAAMPFYRRDDLAIADPSGRGPVTEADRASHRTIVDLLTAARPDDPVLSEEGEAARGHGDGRLWVVDPLDGTREFIARNGEFSVMVGLAVDGAARLGAVYQPDPDRLYVGIVGEGAWRIERASDDFRGQVLQTMSRGSGTLRIVGSRSHPDPRLQRIEASLAPVERVVSGSVGIKCAMIAETDADLYIHPIAHLKEWDTCAPEAMLRGAGGWVGNCVGGGLTYGKPEPVQPFGIFAACDEDLRKRVATVVHAIGSTLTDEEGAIR